MHMRTAGDATAHTTYNSVHIRDCRNFPPFYLQSNLARSCSKLQEEYDVLLYGGLLEWLSTSTRSEFLKFSPPVVFEKVATSHLFFGTRDCLRADPSSCFPPGHEFYEVRCHKCTHNFVVGLECPLLSISYFLRCFSQILRG